MAFTRKNLLEFILVLGGKASIVGVIFVGGVLVARLAGPVEYGVFSVAITAVLLCDGMIGAPLDMAAVRFSSWHTGERPRTQRFEAMALHLKLMLAAILFLSALALRPFYARLSSHLADGSFPFVACLAATACLLAARSAGTGLQIRHRFKEYSLLDLSQGAVRLLGFAMFAALGLARTLEFLGAYAVAALGAALCGLAFFGQNYLLGAWPSRDDASRMLRYCGYSAGIIALGTVTGRGDLLILATARGSASVSAYGLASQLTLLVAQVALYASVLTQPRVIPLAREGRVRAVFMTNLALVAVAALVGALLLHPDLLRWATTLVFGKGFDRAVPLLRILLLGALLDLLIVPVLMVFCIQVCPAQTFRGEILITGGFLAAALAAATGRFPLPAEQAMAWVAVGTRVAKLLLYGGLFAMHTTPAARAALGSPADTLSGKRAGTLDRGPAVAQAADCFVSRPAD
jgi:O-antigen/teichoic acid export membrane protein